MVLLSGKHSADAIEDDIVATVDVLNHDLITLVEEELKVGHDVKDEQSYKILSIPGKGNGMIATRKLYPGEVIISETPLLVIPEKTFDNADKLESYLERQINKLSSDDRNKFFDLSDCRIVEKNAFDGYSYCGSCYTNAMTYGDDAAICPTIAMANHSCKPNAEFVTRADLGKQLLVTMYIIEAGEEICINYMAMTEEATEAVEVRQAYLRKFYGFQCCCRACVLKDDALKKDTDIRENIKELQSVDIEELDLSELEELIRLVYQINGKLTFILQLFDPLYRKASEGSLRRLEHAISGFTLAINLYGNGSEEANSWKAKVDMEKSTILMTSADV